MTFTQALDNIGRAVKKITDSRYYLWGVNLLILLCWLSDLFFVGAAAAILCFIVILFTQKNINGIMPFFAGILFCIGDIGGEIGHSAIVPDFYDTFLVMLWCFSPFLAGGMIYFWVKNKIRLACGTLTSGLLVFFAVALLGGAGTRLFTLSGFVTVLLYALVIVFAYLFLRSALDFKEIGFKKTFCLCFLAASLVVATQIVIFYLRAEDFKRAFTEKLLYLGWGIGATAGQAIVMFLPFVFYLLLTAEKKTAVVLYHLAILYCLAGLVLARARANVFAMALIVVPLYVVTSLKTPKGGRKKTSLYTMGAIVALFAALLIAYRDTAGEYFGILIKPNWGDDISSGRWELWADGWNAFRQSPILGKSFFYTGGFNFGYIEEGFIYWYWYHNTPLQVLVNTGVAGFAAFSYYMGTKYRTYARKGDFLNFYFFMSLLGAEIIGLLDINIFTIGYVYYMLLFVTGAEQLVDPRGAYWLGARHTVNAEGQGA